MKQPDKKANGTDGAPDHDVPPAAREVQKKQRNNKVEP